MRVLVLGATGFTGATAVEHLLRSGFEVRCLVRTNSVNRQHIPEEQIEIVTGDATDRSSISRAAIGCEAVISLIPNSAGYAPNIVKAIEEAKVARIVYIGTTAVFTALDAPTKKVYSAAEQTIISGSLDYTILRPTMIYGTHRDLTIHRLVSALKKYPVFPVPGPGTSLQQPVYVADVAEAIVGCLKSPRTIGKAYNISGANPLTFNAMIDTIATLLGKKIVKLHIPTWLAVPGTNLAMKLGLPVPIKPEQIRRLNENKTFENSEAQRDFGYTPLAFTDGIRKELEDMGIVPHLQG